MTTQSLTPSIAVADVPVRQDADGRYCLNDLHKAAGGENKHRPSLWLENKQTIELVTEVEKAGIPAIQSKQQVGTFVVRELVYAYAMWISASFHLKVIRTFDAVMTGNTASVETLLPSEQQTLMEIVHAKVGDYPKETQGKALAEIWSRIHNKYRIAKYDQLPRTQLAEVILYVTQMELKTKGASPQRLSPRELQALTHLVNEIADKLHFGGVVRTATWNALHAVAGNVNRDQFEVQHIPALATEIRRLLGVVEHYRMIAMDTEQRFIRQAFRADGMLEELLAEVRQRLDKAASDAIVGINNRLAAWQERQIQELLTRTGTALAANA